ncbi:hypothetical protein GYA49_02875 [Candidatus Beckwithbacteria bacterium]|nr:hypothetical protein [Candidatus Beckwithbacteria bacterium]
MTQTLSKYYQVFKISLEDQLVYRARVLLWRIRSVIRFLTTYFFWLAMFSNNPHLYNYSRADILTYVFMSQILYDIIYTTLTDEVAVEIAQGSLGNYLLKPVNYLKYKIAIGLADKSHNVFFSILEAIGLYFIFRPPFRLPQLGSSYLIFIAAVILACILYFELSYWVSLHAFWFRENAGWPIRFLFMMLVSFLSGNFFPLNFLPKTLFTFLTLLPTTYLTYVPIQFWLEKTDSFTTWFSFVMMILWITILGFLIQKTWKKGLQIYESEGK